MIRVDSARDQVSIAKLFETGQGHIFADWDDLGISERNRLLAQIAEFDPHELERLVRTLVNAPAESANSTFAPPEPAPIIPLPHTPLEEQERARAVATGTKALLDGEVGVFTVAGGQGTRLKFDGPKGMFPVGPVTQRSLFEVFAHKVLALSRRLRRAVPWFIMTSDANHDTTREFFLKSGFFGLNPGDVYFRMQGLLPMVDLRGKILLRGRGEILMGPDGHGAAVRVIAGLRDVFEERGVRTIFYHQVDNPLTWVCDPAFIGYHLLRDSQFSSKAVLKERPEEKVGVFCVVDGRMRVVEYTELSRPDAARRDADGRLTFRAGNIACHVIDVDFCCNEASGAAASLPYHVARKATSIYRDGELVAATQPNSIKFESFLFDVLPAARNPIVLEACRRDEFAPIKNLDGEDSPASSGRALIEIYARWLEAAGVHVPRDSNGRAVPRIEIDPLYADDADELAERIGRGGGIEVADPLVLQ